MTPGEFLKEIVRHLQAAGLPYMVVGSVASNVYGEIRTTYGADIVVDAPWDAVQRFVRGLGQDYYVSEDAARDAWRRRSMFNIIHFASGNKADIICRKDHEYARVAFGRRRRDQALGIEVELCSPEDLILAKLEWSRKGESERQYRDALGVAKTQREALDLDYLTRWADELGVSELFLRLLEESGLRRPPSPG